MPLVRATQQFDHDGHKVSRGEEFRVSDTAAREFERRGLAKIVSHMGAARPRKGPGAPPSASPVVPASQQTTAILSEAGEALERTPRNRRERRQRAAEASS